MIYNYKNTEFDIELIDKKSFEIKLESLMHEIIGSYNEDILRYKSKPYYLYKQLFNNSIKYIDGEDFLDSRIYDEVYNGDPNKEEFEFFTPLNMRYLDYSFNESGDWYLYIIKDIKPTTSTVYFPEMINDIKVGAYIPDKYNIYSQVKKLYISRYMVAVETFIGRFNNLKSLHIDPNSKYYSSNGDMLMSKDGSLLIRAVTGLSDRVFILPETIEYIGTRAFYNTNCEEIYIDDKNRDIKYVSKTAFMGAPIERRGSIILHNYMIVNSKHRKLVIPENVNIVHFFNNEATKGYMDIVFNSYSIPDFVDSNGLLNLKINELTLGNELALSFNPEYLSRLLVNLSYKNTEIIIPDNHIRYMNDEGVIFSNSMDKLYFCSNGFLNLTYYVPEEVKEIDVGAFAANTNIKIIYINFDCEHIGICALRNISEIYVKEKTADGLLSLPFIGDYNSQYLTLNVIRKDYDKGDPYELEENDYIRYIINKNIIEELPDERLFTNYESLWEDNCFNKQLSFDRYYTYYSHIFEPIYKEFFINNESTVDYFTIMENQMFAKTMNYVIHDMIKNDNNIDRWECIFASTLYLILVENLNSNNMHNPFLSTGGIDYSSLLFYEIINNINFDIKDVEKLLFYASDNGLTIYVSDLLNKLNNSENNDNIEENFDDI